MDSIKILQNKKINMHKIIIFLFRLSFLSLNLSELNVLTHLETPGCTRNLRKLQDIESVDILRGEGFCNTLYKLIFTFFYCYCGGVSEWKSFIIFSSVCLMNADLCQQAWTQQRLATLEWKLFE